MEIVQRRSLLRAACYNDGMQTQTTTSREIDVRQYCEQLADRAGAAASGLAALSGAERQAALGQVADQILSQQDLIQSENEKDLAAGREAGLTPAMLDRLTLDTRRIEAMAESVRQIADQSDPVGGVIEGYIRPNGLRIEKVRVPIGVVLIIFESRPNVTSDAAALCLKKWQRGDPAWREGSVTFQYSYRAVRP